MAKQPFRSLLLTLYLPIGYESNLLPFDCRSAILDPVEDLEGSLRAPPPGPLALLRELLLLDDVLTTTDAAPTAPVRRVNCDSSRTYAEYESTDLVVTNEVTAWV
jgi:hypothetical protein